MNTTLINDLSKEIFEFNKSVGWWDDMDRPIFQILQLVSTEIAEATEGARKNLMDNHLPHRKSEEVELADALIRILDFGGRYELEYSSRLKYSHPQDLRMAISSFSCVAEMHFYLNSLLANFGKIAAIMQDPMEPDVQERMHDHLIDSYSALIFSVVWVSKRCKYDLLGALKEKFEFNKTRADHKRENRAKEHGKKF